MLLICAVLCGFLLDLLLGDPAWMPHPVVGMGRAIAALERLLRRLFPGSRRGLLAAGTCLAAALPLGTVALSGVCVGLAGRVHPALGFALQAIWCWQALAAKGLRDEAMHVRRELERGDLPAARRAVSRIVGRDTRALTEQGVTRAAVETVAENFSDGVLAPLFYMLIGGAPLALCYKAVNTMDSMVGYKNDRYLFFGRAAAKLDDAANFLPARLAALFLIAAAFLLGLNGRGAFRIWRRDARKHPSPNSAETESACAGALGIELAGPARYFGKLCDKPAIGDATRPCEPEDIRRSCRMLYAASFLALVVLCAVRAAVVCAIGSTVNL